MTRILAMLLLSCLFGCPATDEQIITTLRSAGYTHIKDLGPAIIGCAEQEVGSRFSARNPLGLYVEGQVCCGGYLPISKGCTIRF
jgi:hypothetical protein